MLFYCQIPVDDPSLEHGITLKGVTPPKLYNTLQVAIILRRASSATKKWIM
jgi:hypothetical protein